MGLYRRSGGGLVSGIISLLANRRVFIGGGFNVVFYGMTVIKFLPYPIKTDIDDCTSQPCKNNGNCTDQVNGFNCSCAPGFNGTQCATVSRKGLLLFIVVDAVPSV